jgi:hypothetical protein
LERHLAPIEARFDLPIPHPTFQRVRRPASDRANCRFQLASFGPLRDALVNGHKPVEHKINHGALLKNYVANRVELLPCERAHFELR